jgi:hypothetical protein
MFGIHDINAEAPNKALALIILGCIFNLNGMVWCNALSKSH